LRQLYEEAGDTDSLRTRASAIVYSYKKAGVDVGVYAKEFEDTLGVKPYGLEREIKEEDVKGRSGLQEVLEGVLGEAEALEVMRGLEDVFKTASPYRDSIIEVLDFEKQLYAVANLRKFIIVRARRVEGRGLVYKERVADAAPVEVILYESPIGGVEKFEIKWKSLTRNKIIAIGPAPIAEHIARLKEGNLIISQRLAEDVIPAVIQGFVKKGRAEVREELDSPGFYEIEGRIVSVRFPVEHDLDGLREALRLLRELGDVWFKHAVDKFSTTIKWAILAPFSYIYKLRNRWVPWLYLYGVSKTGKSTFGDIVLSIWGLGVEHAKTGGHIDTPAKVGRVLSESTFPVVINEPMGALVKEDVVEIIKNAVERPHARGKHVRGTYISIPSLAPLLFTSNRYLPRDDTLLRRFIVLNFTYEDRIPGERSREFDAKVRPRFNVLKHIGFFTAKYAIENGLPEEPWEFPRKVLEEAFKAVGEETPKWVQLSLVVEENFEEIYENMKELIRAHIVKRVNEEYARLIGKLIVEGPREGDYQVKDRAEVSVRERISIVLEKGLLPWAIVQGGVVYITTMIREELRNIIGDMSMKSLAQLLEWNYIPKKSFKIKKSVVNKSVIEVPVEDFIDFLTPEASS
jgi:hypothetical protein